MHKMASKCHVQVLGGAKFDVEACKNHDLRVFPQTHFNGSLWSQNPTRVPQSGLYGSPTVKSAHHCFSVEVFPGATSP